MADNIQLGRRGEEVASDFLRKKGYKIRDTNWRIGKNELDLIAEEGKILVVVEVKTRRSNVIAEPETSVTRDKQRAIIRAANAYVRMKQLNMEVRFDIISIVMTEDQERINHIPDAFYPML
jgi:putative endonuclease